MKVIFNIVCFIFLFGMAFCQTTEYPHCGGIEIKTDSTYIFKKGDLIMEEGYFSHGQRSGIWIVRNSSGQILSQAVYKEGLHDGP